MALGSKMDPFSKLPSLILLTIVKLLPDLASLRHLDRASPVIASLFNDYGPEITEAVMSTSLPEAIQVLIRSIVIIRSKSIPSRSLDDFKEEFLFRDKPCLDYGNGNECILRLFPDPKTRGCQTCGICGFIPRHSEIKWLTHPSILRSILDSAVQVQQLTFSCLQKMIDRCLALRPSHLLDPRFIYRERPNYRSKCPQRRPEGRPYTPRDSGPPTWVEIQRVSRAMWRIQLFLDLKTGALDSNLGWLHDDATRLQSTSIEEFWSPYGSDRLEQLRTVVEYLQELETHDGIIPGTLHRLPTITTEAKAQWPQRSANDILAFEDVYAAKGFHFSQRPEHGRESALKGVDFGLYRRFGFYIWEQERMVGLGFLNPSSSTGPEAEDPNSYMTRYNLWFTWESILSADLIEQRECQRLSDFPEGRTFGFSKYATYWANW
ncbi:hypothetical protein PVAG01_01990 [Phlyctema vagabunda]|uniref:F-box domain-containing protein n=1 Tax=Phlyctema vagabunda TaxID=108571 RepID=A0ABR4PZJ6_9HELO